MNIKEAKLEVEQSVRAYLARDTYGQYRIERMQQRPLLLIGAPGLGKTAIMAQIAREQKIGLIAYSMTHHTRQSAIGLPFIEKHGYRDQTFHITKYTMSEIVASIYAYMEKTGLTEGILFLDEINCISETLTPMMLQFLQYKSFGNHPIPEGWVIVCAGNPPEYNKSVREFDVVTLDRVKKIQVEPDYGVWREYALARAVHPAVITYLDARKKHFYSIENTSDGKAFVTARGWEDLSRILLIYEDLGMEVTERLIAQYVQDESISREFAIYYSLFCRYRSDYHITDILEGHYDQAIRNRAVGARFDERLSLLGLLIDALHQDVQAALREEQVIAGTLQLLQEAKELAGIEGGKVRKRVKDTDSSDSSAKRTDKNTAEGTASASLLDALPLIRAKVSNELSLLLSRGHLTRQEESLQRELIRRLDLYTDSLAKSIAADDPGRWKQLRKEYAADVSAMEQSIDHARDSIDHLFGFVEEVWGKNQEMLVLLGELTARAETAEFLARYGSDAYFQNNEAMLFYQREIELINQVGNE